MSSAVRNPVSRVRGGRRGHFRHRPKTTRSGVVNFSATKSLPRNVLPSRVGRTLPQWEMRRTPNDGNATIQTLHRGLGSPEVVSTSLSSWNCIIPHDAGRSTVPFPARFKLQGSRAACRIGVAPHQSAAMNTLASSAAPLFMTNGGGAGRGADAEGVDHGDTWQGLHDRAHENGSISKRPHAGLHSAGPACQRNPRSPILCVRQQRGITCILRRQRSRSREPHNVHSRRGTGPRPRTIPSRP